MRILLVEDDRLLGESLHRALTLAHYACDWISDGNQVAALLSATHFDLLVLDIGLPGRSGLEVLREMRKKNIRLQMVKNSLFRRVTGGTGVTLPDSAWTGTTVIAWGGDLSLIHI